jgi:hypothetical protein
MVFKLFENFINESGNSIENAVPFTQEDVGKTVKWIEENIFPNIGLSGIGIDAAVIGSAGKKGPDQTSGDIDIAVSADKIAGYLGVSLDKKDIINALSDRLAKMEYSITPSFGFSQVSVGVPIPGRNGEVGQVDLMLSTDLEWSTFIYHSPDFSKGESKYKGAYRNMLLMSAIGKSNYKVIKKTDSDETEEYESYVVRLDQGIYQVRKSFMGKKGLKKTADLLKEYDKLVTKTPQDVVDILFTNKKPSDIDTYEKLKELIDSDSYKFPDNRDEVYEDFIQRVEVTKMPLPDDMKKNEQRVVTSFENFKTNN